MFFRFKEGLSGAGVARKRVGRATFIVSAMMLGFGAAPAHEGHDDAEPPMTQFPSQHLHSVSGGGLAFEAVMKYAPFEPGSAAELRMYLLSTADNRPVDGATIKGTLSEGASSQDVTFTPAVGGLPGSYTAEVTPSGGGPWSWLLDVTAGRQNDLIAVTGFTAGDAPGGGVTESQATLGYAPAVPPGNLLITGIAVAALVLGFGAGRLTARRTTA